MPSCSHDADPAALFRLLSFYLLTVQIVWPLLPRKSQRSVETQACLTSCKPVAVCGELSGWSVECFSRSTTVGSLGSLGSASFPLHTWLLLLLWAGWVFPFQERKSGHCTVSWNPCSWLISASSCWSVPAMGLTTFKEQKCQFFLSLCCEDIKQQWPLLWAYLSYKLLSSGCTTLVWFCLFGNWQGRRITFWWLNEGQKTPR